MGEENNERREEGETMGGEGRRGPQFTFLALPLQQFQKLFVQPA